MNFERLEIERFMVHVAPANERGCTLWTACDNGRKGYGRFARHRRFTPRYWLAHRFAWAIVHGPAPVGVHVCHRCDTPRCVNVEHLFLGTNSDNMRDCVAKGRARGLIEKGDRRLAAASVLARFGKVI